MSDILEMIETFLLPESWAMIMIKTGGSRRLRWRTRIMPRSWDCQAHVGSWWPREPLRLSKKKELQLWRSRFLKSGKHNPLNKWSRIQLNSRGIGELLGQYFIWNSEEKFRQVLANLNFIMMNQTILGKKDLGLKLHFRLILYWKAFGARDSLVKSIKIIKN